VRPGDGGDERRQEKFCLPAHRKKERLSIFRAPGPVFCRLHFTAPDLEAIMKALPIGISTFSKVICENYAYVDKTGYIRTLTDKGKL
jgi:hypothetical protein